ncbi:hypothetical protein [Streptomyces lavendulae]|uniref:hypothetical protein n=1 Tax=Streptomyces lavendulae TaxID=1914 RepID=UPI0036F003CA
MAGTMPPDRRHWRGSAADGSDADGGRGLFLVEAIADRWAVAARGGPGKQVRAELSVKGR